MQFGERSHAVWGAESCSLGSGIMQFGERKRGLNDDFTCLIRP
jgi:hypothetical protein